MNASVKNGVNLFTKKKEVIFIILNGVFFNIIKSVYLIKGALSDVCLSDA